MPIDSILCTDTTKLRPKLTNPNRARRVAIDSTSEILKLLNAAGSLVQQIDDTHNFSAIAGNWTMTGVLTLTQLPVMSAVGGVQLASVTLTNAEIKALRATPKTIVAAPGAGKVVVPLLGIFVLIAGTNVLTESTANLALKYTDGSGTQISETVESTGFIDQAASTMTTVRMKQDGIVAKTAADNKLVCLHNLGAGEFGGNAAADATMKVQLLYTLASPGW